MSANHIKILKQVMCILKEHRYRDVRKKIDYPPSVPLSLTNSHRGDCRRQQGTAVPRSAHPADETWGLPLDSLILFRLVLSLMSV